ncbi:MAG TPA: oligosaccharide flippase family protein, partial [Anaerolineales bacterium]|nr:oligosaccharide flippase family protein [Anaerolineales bacterium]
MSSLKSVSSNVTWLSADRVVRLGLNALSWIIVMRVVGPEAFGRFSYAYAAYLMFVPVVAFGLDNVVVRWLIRAPDAAPSILGSGLALR